MSSIFRALNKLCFIIVIIILRVKILIMDILLVMLIIIMKVVVFIISPFANQIICYKYCIIHILFHVILTIYIYTFIELQVLIVIPTHIWKGMFPDMLN